MGWILNASYALVLLISSPYLAIRSLQTGRYRKGWSQKLLGLVPKTENDQSLIWLHAVSVGEVQLMRSLIRGLRETLPHKRLVLSTTTQTGMDLAKEAFPDITLFYLPLDFTWAVKKRSSATATINACARRIGNLAEPD